MKQISRHITTLIQGTFTQHNAKELLLALLSHKIQYHQRQVFSDVERHGKESELSEKRIRELEREKQELLDWISSLESSDSLSIHCSVEIRTAQ